MKRSLRRRAIIGGLIWAAFAFAGAGVTLYRVMDSIVIRRLDEQLAEALLQVASVMSNGRGSSDEVAAGLPAAAFNRPYSGEYWQAEGPQGETFSSRSLFDSLLNSELAEEPGVQYWNGAGPYGEVRGLTRTIVFDETESWRVTVAKGLTTLNVERQRIRTSLALTFGALGAFGVLATVILSSLLLQPLNKLRHDVTNRWNSGKRLNPDDYPSEVAPLVTDLNDVLDRNAGILERGRRRAADLAHALNTPAAIMRNELESLEKSGADTIRVEDALNRIESQITRSLARARAENSAGASRVAVAVSESLERLSRAFQRLNEGTGRSLTIRCDHALEVFMDREDLEEALGNIIDNAFKWCKSAVRIECSHSDRMIGIVIEDDGPGIPEDSRREALRAGGRLDHAAPGTGLGLAIVSDLALAYGGSLELGESSDLHGLAVALSLPGRVKDAAV